MHAFKTNNYDAIKKYVHSFSVRISDDNFFKIGLRTRFKVA